MDNFLEFDKTFPHQALSDGLFGVRRAANPTGTPIVMIPGASGTSEFFMYVAPTLVKAGLDPILIDYPGTVLPTELCAETERLTERLKLQNAIVLGCSYSAYWLQYLPANSQYTAAILANGFVNADDLLPNPLFDHDAIKSTPAPAVTQEWLQRTYKQADSHLKQLLLAALQKWLKPEDLKGRLLQVSSAVPIASEFNGPVAIIDSDEDALVDAEARLAFRHAWPEACHVEVPGGHYPYVNQPQAFSEAVIRLVSDVKQD